MNQPGLHLQAIVGIDANVANKSKKVLSRKVRYTLGTL